MEGETVNAGYSTWLKGNSLLMMYRVVQIAWNLVSDIPTWNLDSVPCGTHCLESGLGHIVLLALFPCCLGLLGKGGWILCVLYNVMDKEDVTHDGAPVGCTFLTDIVSSFGASTNPDSGILLFL